MPFGEYDWKPLVAWHKRELLDYRAQLEWRIKNLDKEMDRRGQRDEMKYGYPITVAGEKGIGITTAYRWFDTDKEAWKAAIEEFGEGGPYKVHPVYLGKDDFKGQLDFNLENEDENSTTSKS